MISLDSVSKSYLVKGVHKQVLDHITFEFPKGRNLALMGRNGAGKSTLLRLVSGAEMPTSGDVHRRERVSWPMGFSGGFNGMMTGVENIRFVARIYGQDSDEVLEEVEEFAELGASLDVPIATYSSGMKARLAFGLSLAVKFDTYLIDEITAVGDRRFKMKSRAALGRAVETSRVVMVSHSPAAVKDYCDAGLLLYEGQLYYYDEIEALLADYRRFC